MYRYGTYSTPHGIGAVVTSKKGICRVILPQPNRRLAVRKVLEEFPDATADKSGAGVRMLRRYFEGKPLPDDMALDMRGVPDFHRQVYRMTQAIPHGETRSYKWVASCLGKVTAARAVGVALSRNPVPVIIPCHRVVASDGSLGGWSGEPGWKERLLELEGANGWAEE
ncbi:MAG: methylated-DNA--[protein]-cysteine S-methyltransferase [Actinobacteria bacterium]|nr:MAG: methylated-DNA--[protein]-cysteine S-methyltransferase [Actinomycetota bacterium]